jgi:exosortase A-associated hydrolase 2
MAFVTVDPFFFDAPSGRLFAVHHRPSDAALVRGHVLCVPPFNEEMNRCRSMVALQAQALARYGIGTLLLDLYGTGDSAGDYVDARWQIWQKDIRAAVAWLNSQPGQCRGLWGIRLGVILAAEAMKAIDLAEAALIAWQPVVDGKQHFTQFLRMRIAAQMERPHLPKETTKSMREQLALGKALEISGYEIHPEFAAAIDNAHLDVMSPAPNVPVLWLEQAAPNSPQLVPASQKVVETWRAAGANVDVRYFEGPNFWQVAERAMSMSAIEATLAWAKQTWRLT